MILVIEPGPLTSVQDPFGRIGWRRFGVPVGGAADAWSARLANRLVGNPDGAALLEVTLGGATFQLEATRAVAVTGGLLASVDGLPVGSAGVVARAGATIRIGPGTGARGYLAIGGGVSVPRVLGSAATDLRTGFGGLQGRALRAGDRLELGEASGWVKRWEGSLDRGPLRVVPGPQPATLDRLIERAWKVGVEADRAGVRLDGERIEGAGEVASMGLPIGAIQVPPDGRPIVMLADRPVTGGYPVPACVIRADVGRVAQLLPGDEVRFMLVSLEDARGALRTAAAALAVQPVDDDLGWIGSHD